MSYKDIKDIKYKCSIDDLNKYEYRIININTLIANKNQINRLIKKHLPEKYQELSLGKINPYPYKRNSKYLILNIRGKEHIFTYTLN